MCDKVIFVKSQLVFLLCILVCYIIFLPFLLVAFSPVVSVQLRVICIQCVEFHCGFVSSCSGSFQCSEAGETFQWGCVGNSHDSNCRCFGLCSALSCLFTVSVRFCFLRVSQLSLFHSEATASEGKSGMLSLWGIGGVGGSCFNSGLGWEKPTSFLLLPRVSRKMSLPQKVLSSLCLLYVYGFSLGPVARARTGQRKAGQPQLVESGEGGGRGGGRHLAAGLCLRLLPPNLFCGYLFSLGF